MQQINRKRTQRGRKSPSHRLNSQPVGFDRGWRRSVFERFKERSMLRIARYLQNYVEPYPSAINTALSVATSLPLLGLRRQVSGD